MIDQAEEQDTYEFFGVEHKDHIHLIHQYQPKRYIEVSGTDPGKALQELGLAISHWRITQGLVGERVFFKPIEGPPIYRGPMDSCEITDEEAIKTVLSIAGREN